MSAQWHLTLAFCGWQSATVCAQLAQLDMIRALPAIGVELDRRIFWPEARAWVLEACRLSAREPTRRASCR